MVVTLKAIDTILKLVPYLTSLTGERRRSYFEKVIKILFENVSATHNYYLEIIDSLKITAAELGIENKLQWENQDFSYEFALKKLELAKSEFCSSRESSTTLRSVFRIEAKQIFNEVKWSEEKCFLLLVMFYFNGLAHMELPDEDYELYIEAQFEMIEEASMGAISVWDTPSAIIAHRIADVSSSKKLVTILNEHRVRLNHSFENVTLAFKKIEREII